MRQGSGLGPQGLHSEWEACGVVGERTAPQEEEQKQRAAKGPAPHPGPAVAPLALPQLHEFGSGTCTQTILTEVDMLPRPWRQMWPHTRLAGGRGPRNLHRGCQAVTQRVPSF